MPRFSTIPDSEFEVSLNSKLSDKRIMMWRNEKERVIKIRIVAKELSYQLQQWDQKELAITKRSMDVAYSSKAEEAYGLFVRLYFNLKPMPDVPYPEERL
jgi:hypothetical protein